MEKCFRCGIPENKSILYDIITEKKIMKVCRKCSYLENAPIIERKVEPVKEQPNFRQRISSFQRVDIRKEAEKRELKKQDEYLRNVVNRNSALSLGKGFVPENLTKNFHWIIMRARRMRHITQGQLAESINEPEAAIRMVERGLVPENNTRVIKKIEDYLGISLKSGNDEAKNTRIVSQKSTFAGKNDLSIDEMRRLSISDLHDMKKEKETMKDDFLENDSGIEFFEEQEYYDSEENGNWR